jgi:hypothetical protein
VPRTFYRIVRSNPPALRDFSSNAALGKSPTGQTDTSPLADGISVTATLAQARRRARRYPEIGAFVAVLEIADDADVRAERTLSSAGHHTLWASPELLLAAVTQVFPLEKDR